MSLGWKTLHNAECSACIEWFNYSVAVCTGLRIYLTKHQAKNHYNSQNSWFLAIERKALQQEKDKENHSEIIVEMCLFKAADNYTGLIISEGA